MKSLIIIFLSAIFLQFNYSQEPVLEWVARYSDGPEKDNYAQCMAVDSAGNVFIAGRDSELPYGFSLIKYSPSGQFLWRKRYSGGSNIILRPVELTVDLQGNVYVGANDNRYVILKYNPVGVLQWVKIHDGGGATNVEGIYLMENNKLIVSGSTPLSSPGGQVRPGVRTMSLNTSTGDSIWSRAFVFNSPYTIFAEALDRTNITGDWIQPPPPNQGIITISYDINGNLKWWRVFHDSSSTNYYGMDITTDKNGNVYVAGYLYYNNVPDKVAVLKYDALGNLLWYRIVEHPVSYYYVKFIKTDPWDNVIIASHITLPGPRSMCIIKYNPNGQLLWYRIYSGSTIDNSVSGMSIDKHGSVYVTGTSDDQQYPPRYRIATVKYDKDGNLKWVKQYYPVFYPDSVGNPVPNAGVIVDQNLNVYVAGTIKRLHNGSGFVDALLLKYSQPIGIEPISTEIPEKFELHQNYPNPFNPITKIKFSVPKRTFVKIIIYDAVGKEIAKIVSQELKSGIYETEFNAGNISSGVYFYKFVVSDSYGEANDETGDKVIYSETRKMVVVK